MDSLTQSAVELVLLNRPLTEAQRILDHAHRNGGAVLVSDILGDAESVPIHVAPLVLLIGTIDARANADAYWEARLTGTAAQAAEAAVIPWQPERAPATPLWLAWINAGDLLQDMEIRVFRDRAVAHAFVTRAIGACDPHLTWSEYERAAA